MIQARRPAATHPGKAATARADSPRAKKTAPTIKSTSTSSSMMCVYPFPMGYNKIVTSPDVHVHVHLDLPGLVDYSPRFTTLEELIMTTKAELETQIDELVAVTTEAASDLTRVLEELAELVAQGDLTAIAAKVDQVKAIAVAMSEAADAAVADPTDVPPVEPPVV